MNNIVPIDQAMQHLPSAMRQRVQQGLAANSNFSDGVQDSFPLLSIRGKTFHVRINGEETPFIDPQTRQSMGSLDVVMVNASAMLSKTYYIKGYTPGDLNPPDCWSLDAVRPDERVANKVSVSCISCPMNQFGSAPSRDPSSGKRGGKACQDARRIAVVMPHMLNETNPLIMLLKIPQSSLKNLKNYAQMLERHGIDPVGVITRLSFDYQEAYPKLIFNFVNVLDDEQYGMAVDMAEGQVVSSMLQAPDFENAPSTEPQQNPQAGPVLQPLAQQAPPILGTPPVNRDVGPMVTGVVPPQQAAPAQAIPEQEVQLIELPDNKWFNPVTRQYVEKPTPALDLKVIELPGGQFFNMETKQYVTSPYVGGEAAAAPATPAPAPVTRKRAPAPARKEAAAPAPAPAPAPEKAAAQKQIEAVTQAANAAVTNGSTAPVDSGDKQAGDAPAGAKVTAAPAALEDILKKLVPSNSK